MSFWILLIIMVAAGLLLLSPALRTRKTVKLDDEREQNIAIARERIQELKDELDAGTLSEATYQQTLEELEKSLLIDVADIEAISEKTSTRSVWIMSIAVLVIVPALSFGMYSMLGSPQYLDVVGPGTPATAIGSKASDGKIPTMEEMISGLEKKTAEKPNDPNGWYLLGRLYAASDRFADSVKAYERLVEVSDRTSTALVVLADSIAMTQDMSLSGRPQQLIDEALKKDPEHVTALWMAGQAAADAKQHTKAIDYWLRAAQGLTDNKEMLTDLGKMIDEAVVLAKEAGMEVPDINLPDVSAVISVSIKVTIDPSLQSSLEKDDVLFVFARDASGPPMPVAAIKRQASELPITVVLDNTSLLRPGSRLLDYKQLKIAARVSHSGQPIAQSGDLHSKSKQINPATTTEINLLIDEVVP